MKKIKIYAFQESSSIILINTFVFSDWALPKHLLESILERLLSSSDYLRFSVVCMSWFGVAKDNQSQHAKKMLSHQEPPMLLFFNDKKDAWSLYNILDDKVHDVQLRMPNRRFCGSSKGWLVVVEENFAVTLINPLSKSKGMGERENLVIRLPQLNPPELSVRDIGREEWVEDCEYYVIKATITADPIMNANDCIVFVMYAPHCRTAFIRIGKDTTWTYIEKPCTGIVDVLQREGGKFYAVQRHGSLITFNITSESYSDVKYFACDVPPTWSTIMKYLVESNEKDLMMVERRCDWEDRENLNKRFALEFKVFKFDFDKWKWIEKKTLGEDVALFIGGNLSMFVVASNFPGCKQNCIYYNHDVDFIAHKDLLHDFGVYDMEKKSISKPYSTHLMTLLEMTNQRPIWFTPTIQL